MGPTRAILNKPSGLRLATIFALAYVAILPGLAQSDPKVLEYKATVAAAREAEVAPRLDGLLTTINFSAGQLVKKGDLLFEFGSRNAELPLALAQSHLKQAEAQLRLAEINLKNKRTLRARNVASEMQFLDAQAQRDIAAAKVDEARVNVGIGQVALQQMKLYAPIAGIISRAFMREGAYVTKEAREQSRLATIVQLDPIHVVGQAPAAAYFQRSDQGGGALKTLEQTAEQREFWLVLPTGDKYPHKGRLVAGAYEFNVALQTTEVTVEFPNPDYLLRPGLSVTLQSLVRRN
jgi:membrane fusion protein (multidrug efflux system)